MHYFLTTKQVSTLIKSRFIPASIRRIRPSPVTIFYCYEDVVTYIQARMDLQRQKSNKALAEYQRWRKRMVELKQLDTL